MKSRVLLPLLAALALPAAAADPVKVLIVDGYTNHDWQRTTALIRGVLEPTKLFEIAISTVPAKTDDPAYAAWSPDFTAHDVVIQTTNDINKAGPYWPEKARADFEKFARDGGGVFIFHSANNAFPNWDAYNTIIGLGWRSKTFGNAIRVRPDGTLERIPSGEGDGTGHGPRTDRQIRRLGEHPIHAGLPKIWMTPEIEVYTHARGPAENITILSCAEEPKTKELWPMEWTVEFGKGRVYNSTFGHVWQGEANPVNMRCAGFQTVFVRALHWLAKREVPKVVPADFPTAEATSLR